MIGQDRTDPDTWQGSRQVHLILPQPQPARNLRRTREVESGAVELRQSGAVEWSVVECGVVWWRWILSHLWNNPSHLSDEPMVDTCREYRGLPGVSPSDRCGRTQAALRLGLYARASACSIPRSLPARECGLGARERESSRGVGRGGWRHRQRRRSECQHT